ncbi:MAG TPA: type I glutamate--ammonia ligase [Chloroflexi bacterium]|nr:type I glutamate--ammonia ligase [Chloroflexota bacterium]
MFSDFSEAQEFVQREEIRMIDLKFCDLWGAWHHVSLPAREFVPALMEQGVGIDGSSIGFKGVESGDMVVVPDLTTGAMDPFWSMKTLSFICHIREAGSLQAFGQDPRAIALRAERYMVEQGVAERSSWGPEFEFYVFDSVAIDNAVNRAGYRVESREADWQSGQDGLGYQIRRHGGYHAIPPSDTLYDLRSEITACLEAMGVAVRYHHHEVGGPGQSEIEIALIGIQQAGDATMLTKYAAKMVARQRGQTVTFMPKPLYGEAGNGMHFHQTLWQGDRNLFYDPAGYAGLSDTALHYIGGLLKHASALLAFTNPSTNSYRRLVPGYEAPVSSFFSLANRTAAIRVPKYAATAETKRIEFRLPDATCNVYLALTAQLMAGVDGVLREIDPVAEGFGPYDEDIFAWSPEERARLKALPTSLDEALQAVEEDRDFLLAGGVFTEDLIEAWVRHKREQEFCAVRERPHPYEMVLYFDT